MTHPLYNWCIILAALGVCLAGALGPFAGPSIPLDQVEWLDVAGEATFLVGALAFAALIHRFKLPPDTRRLFFFAAIFLLVGQVQDVADELIVITAFTPSLIENVGRMVGIGTLAVAIVNVMGTVERTQEEREVFRLASHTDSLTALGNRQQLDSVLSDLINECRQNGYMLSVVFVDVDNFKQTNDRYGHALGDKVLQALADIIRTTIRRGDSGFRLGGEEFVVLLPGSSVVGAKLAAERMRQRFEALTIPTRSGPWKGTISLGVSQLRTGDSMASLVKRADDAMYAAKGAGKNQVILETDLAPSKRSRRLRLVKPAGDEQQGDAGDEQAARPQGR